MTRRPAIDMADRLAAMVTGLLLVGTGVGAVLCLWPTGLLSEVPDTITIESLVAATTTQWWPWALAGIGILLTVIALAWLVSHVPTRTPSMLRIPGDGGTLTIDLGAVAAAAAESLAGDPRLHSAQGKVIAERGVRTLAFTVTLTHPDALPHVPAVVEATCARIREVTGDPALAARTVIELPKHPPPAKRLL